MTQSTATPRTIAPEPLTPTAFAPFGDVLEAEGSPDLMINQGLCARYNDRASMDFDDGRAGLSVFKALPRTLPYALAMVERHPKGSQAFIPMTAHPFMIIVTTGPGDTPRAFLTDGAQGVNLRRGTWHGVLTPLDGPGLFAVVDRIGPGTNLEEHWFAEPWTVMA